ncbi:unnamed protein product [Callosobruchus maculatus]|uniref:THAP-type domain-containing protein n=1 Tax=Callosobruchus maculatus TaxID=64391 RepID=A0A653CJC2_CALMS|nr:unnamed protein product [Callosobruchus maculatus]
MYCICLTKGLRCQAGSFSNVQDQLEVIDETEFDSDERYRFEERYFVIIEKAKKIISCQNIAADTVSHAQSASSNPNVDLSSLNINSSSNYLVTRDSVCEIIKSDDFWNDIETSDDEEIDAVADDQLDTLQQIVDAGDQSDADEEDDEILSEYDSDSDLEWQPTDDEEEVQLDEAKNYCYRSKKNRMNHSLPSCSKSSDTDKSDPDYILSTSTSDCSEEDSYTEKSFPKCLPQSGNYVPVTEVVDEAKDIACFILEEILDQVMENFTARGAVASNINIIITTPQKASKAANCAITGRYSYPTRPLWFAFYYTKRASERVPTARICSIHFEQSSFEIPLRQRLLQYNPKNSRTLKRDARSTLHLPASSCKAIKKTERQTRCIKRDQQAIVANLLKKNDHLQPSTSRQKPEEALRTINIDEIDNIEDVG